MKPKQIYNHNYKVNDSFNTDWSGIHQYLENYISAGIVPRPKPTKGKSWKTKVAGVSYSEMWLRSYATIRQIHGCTVMASDYANRATEHRLPIVRNLDLEQQILYAHAQLLRGQTVRKTGKVLP